MDEFDGIESKTVRVNAKYTKYDAYLLPKRNNFKSDDVCESRSHCFNFYAE